MPPKQAVRALPVAPPLVSLLTSVELMNEADTRWEAGVAYESETCGLTGTGAFAACETSSVAVDPGSTTQDLEPIVIWAGDSCSPYASRDWQARARRQLAACESSIIESELWRGTITRAQAGWTNPYLADNSSISADTPVTPTDALACLEQQLASCNCGSQGMIHATPQVVTHWVSLNLVRRSDRRLLTELGTIVVPGAGYDGSGPALTPGGAPVAPTDGSIWAYATSPVHIRLGPVAVLPGSDASAMNRSTNTITYWAQRIAVFGFDCCHFGIPIDLPLCEVGS